tara:strand:- start:3064 stop:3318 length:255 start_codon:yes stop_codon:yes gene_type:complete
MNIHDQQNLQTVVDYIKNHDDHDAIQQWYIVGPPETTGFMWAPMDTQYKKDLRKVILDMGYDSSAYAWFHRAIQQIIIKEANKK